MPNANCLPPFQWRKKKGSLIPTSFFLQRKPLKKESAKSKEETSVREPENNYTHASDTSEKEKAKPALSAPTPPPVPPKITIAPKEGKHVSSFSLASIRKKKEWEEQQKPTEEEKELPSDAFTQEQLEKYWKEWQDEKTKKKEQNLASLFQLSQPKIIEEHLIEYTVPSPLNKVELEREFVYFLPFIRKALNNFSLQIKVLVKETEEKNFIYTPEEKYNRLREINPAIDELRKKLDLDL